MRGFMRLPMWADKSYRVYGGRYTDRPEWMLGVKMAAEINKPCNVDVPTKDFQVPSVALATQGLKQAVDAVLAGTPVYVGCAGGVGRTGLMLALLAKAWGIKDPVRWVRAEYYPAAVEMPSQHKFIAEFKVPLAVRSKIILYKFKSLFVGEQILTDWPWG